MSCILNSKFPEAAWRYCSCRLHSLVWEAHGFLGIMQFVSVSERSQILRASLMSAFLSAVSPLTTASVSGLRLGSGPSQGTRRKPRDCPVQLSGDQRHDCREAKSWALWETKPKWSYLARKGQMTLNFWYWVWYNAFFSLRKADRKYPISRIKRLLKNCSWLIKGFEWEGLSVVMML